MEAGLRKQVLANVIAGLIVAGVVAAIGIAYSILNSLSVYEIVGYVLLPASGIGVVVALIMFSRSLEELFLHLAKWNGELQKENDQLRKDLDAITAQLGEAEDRLGGQVSSIAYAEVISEAEEEGWKVEIGERGRLEFSHPEWGTAGTGSDDLDPERLRLLLSIGRQTKAAQKGRTSS